MAMALARVAAVTKVYSKTLRRLLTEDKWLFSRRQTFDYLADFSDRLVDMIEREPDRREKIMRWYGFTQGALWALGVFTVTELKAHSNPDVPPPTEDVC